MKNIYEEVNFLDSRAVSEFGLSNELLMENAASALEREIDNIACEISMIIIVVGAGNNGADGLALARHLSGKYNIKIYMPNEPKSELCKIQFARAKSLNIAFVDKLYACDIVVDCLFGSGFRGNLSESHKELINKMNEIARKNIACDIPSGIMQNGEMAEVAFRADLTISMGALKLSYFSDKAKDFIGIIKNANLGISRAKYELDSEYKLLEKSDLKLPYRKSQNVHKGNFGHVGVIAGQKEGACVLSALSAFAFGSGLVSIIGEVNRIPAHIMNSMSLPKKCNAIAFGMGLGDRIEQYNFEFVGKIPSVLDADMFYHKNLLSMLNLGNLVLTPHLKEFASLLKLAEMGEYSAEYISTNKIELAKKFSLKFKNVVLLLKGANTIIASEGKIYINILGTSALAKGGSGDVLSGMIAALLAQGNSLLDSAINASLAHSIASNDFNYALEPFDLINKIKEF